MPQIHSYHTIGLGTKFLGRARIVFALLVILLFLSGGTTVWTGIKTGEFNRTFVEPAKSFLASFEEQEEQPPLPPEITPLPTIIEDQKVPPQGRSIQKTQPSPTPVVIYQQPALGEFPSDWAKQQSEESRINLEEFTRQSQQKLEEFKKQAEEGWQKFREEQRLNQQKIEQQILQ